MFVHYLSIITAFCCAILAIHLFKTRPRHSLAPIILATCFLLFAIQSVFLTLSLEFGRLPLIGVLMPTCALLFGPMFLFYFESLSAPEKNFKLRNIWHFIPAGITFVLVLTNHYIYLIDTIILTSFGGYSLALLVKLAKGKQQFQFLGAHQHIAYRWLIISSALLSISFVSEMLINMELQRGAQLSDSVPLLIEIIIKLVVVSWALWAAMQGSEYFDWYYQGLLNQQAKTINKQATAEFVPIIAALDRTLADPSLLASPLSLKDMATHLNVPIKKLSLAVNQIQGESYSKYLNRKRVLLAKDIMHKQPDVSMTVVMFDAGFRTKSSFNKEFKAIEGVSPSEYALHKSQKL